MIRRNFLRGLLFSVMMPIAFAVGVTKSKIEDIKNIVYVYGVEDLPPRGHLRIFWLENNTTYACQGSFDLEDYTTAIDKGTCWITTAGRDGATTYTSFGR